MNYRYNRIPALESKILLRCNQCDAEIVGETVKHAEFGWHFVFESQECKKEFLKLLGID